MPRITSPGTFVFCKGAMILDGWTVDCEGGSVLTEPEMLELVLRYITALAVDAPRLAAQRDAQREMERLMGKGAPGA